MGAKFECPPIKSLGEALQLSPSLAKAALMICIFPRGILLGLSTHVNNYELGFPVCLRFSLICSTNNN